MKWLHMLQPRFNLDDDGGGGGASLDADPSVGGDDPVGTADPIDPVDPTVDTPIDPAPSSEPNHPAFTPEMMQQFQSSNSQLQRIAAYAGYSDVNELIQAIEQTEQEQRIQSEAERLGMDPDAFRQYIHPMNEQMRMMQTQLQQFQQQEVMRQVQTQVDQLRGQYEDFDNYWQPITELAQRGYSLEDAYKLASYEDRFNRMKQQTEQDVLAGVMGRDQKQVLPSGDKPHSPQFDPSNMSAQDIESLSARARRGERIAL